MGFEFGLGAKTSIFYSHSIGKFSLFVDTP